MKYDIIIIGGGPAGLTAALYAGRRSLKALILTKDIGGQAAKTFDIENYPGIPHTTGPDLSMTMKKQAESFGADLRYEEAADIKKTADGFIVKANSSEYHGKALILASGKKPRELKVKGEDKFKGRGVSYCATCDAPFFRNKNVVIVGGGNSAVDAAILCGGLAKKVYIVHRSQFTAESVMLEKVKAMTNVEMISPDEVAEIRGEQTVKSVILKSGKEIETDGVIVEVGYVVDTSLFKGLVDINEKNQVKTDITQATSMEGIFAAGDLTNSPYKQIVISAGEGAKAALSAYDYIQKIEGKRGIIADWGKKN